MSVSTSLATGLSPGWRHRLSRCWPVLPALGMLLLGPLSVQAQSPAWRWVAHPTESGTALVQKIAADAAGNSYVTGQFTKQIQFGAFALQSAGSTDVYVAKVSAAGQWQWAVAAGGAGTDLAGGIVLSSDGTVTIAGAFTETAQFGPQIRHSQGSHDVFVATLTPTGEWLSVATGGGPDQDQATALAQDAQGNVFVGGRFRGKATFGGSTLESSHDDAFLAKLGPQGQWQWANQSHGSQQAAISSLCVGKGGELYAAGYFAGTAVFGYNSLTSAGTHDAFVAKINGAGTWQWATPGGGSSTDYAKGILVNEEGNIFVTGSFSGQARFGAIEVVSRGGDDAYVAQLNAQGKWQWLQILKSNALEDAADICLGAGGSLYVTGRFSQGAQYGATSLANNGSTDLFVARLSKSGQFLDLLPAGSRAADEAVSIASAPNGDIYVGGKVGAAAQFGTNLLAEDAPQLFIGRVEFPVRLTADTR